LRRRKISDVGQWERSPGNPAPGGRFILTSWTKYQIRANGRPVIKTLVEALYSSKIVGQTLFRDMLFSEKEALKILE
jgi:hypothetical protein